MPLVTWMKGGVSRPCHLTHLLYSVIEQWPLALNSSLYPWVLSLLPDLELCSLWLAYRETEKGV